MDNPYQAPQSNVAIENEGIDINSAEKYAGFWARLVASIIDSILWLLIAAPILYAVYGRDYFFPETMNTEMFAGSVDVLMNWIFPVFIIIALWTLKQATPGKMLLKMKIVDAKTGGKPSMKQWIIRYIGYIVSTIVVFLGFLWVAWDKKKQGWHDKMAGTMVVYS